MPGNPDRLIFVDVPGKATAHDYSLTPDGTSSVFTYWGDDLYSGDEGEADIFVMNNNTGVITLLTVGEGGEKANNDSYLEGVSEDGRTALINSRVTNFANTVANGIAQPYLVDVTTGTITQVLESGPWSFLNSVLSDDGNYVAFSTSAGNIVANDTNELSDVFLFDVAARVITRVTLNDVGEELSGSARISDISADGRYVLFWYETEHATGEEWPSGLYIYDRIEQSNTVVHHHDGGFIPASISASGAIVAYQSLQDGTNTLAWKNIQTGDSGVIFSFVEGFFTYPRVSPDGKYVTYSSNVAGLVDDVAVSGNTVQIYLTELSAGSTILVSQSPGGEEADEHSGSPNFIAFYCRRKVHTLYERSNKYSQRRY